MSTRVGLFAVLATVVVVGVSSAAPIAAPKPLVWFAPLPPYEPGLDYDGSRDYMKLFSRNARWTKAARRIHVFGAPQAWPMRVASDAQVRVMVNDLKRRKIALGFEVGALRDTECGLHVEGFSGTPAATELSLAIKRAGGTIDYVRFDEPFAFGSLYDGPNACHWSAERVAQEVDKYVRELRFYFPKVVVGDIEPVWDSRSPQQIVDWMDTYRRVTGEPLSFLHLDVGRRGPQAPRYVAEAARARGIPFGVIYGGEGESDEEWAAEAEQFFADYEAKDGIRPDHVIFQSWNDKPDYVLPETKRGTFTWLINRYFRPRTKLSLEISDSGATGKLTNARGGALSGRPVELKATPLDGSGSYFDYTLSRTVSAGARTAVVGYRVNTECDCSGPADFTLYESRYQEPGGSNRVPNARFDQGLEGWGITGDAVQVLEPTATGQALHLTAAPGQIANTDSAPFPVTASAQFTVTFSARVSSASTGSGYFHVVFLGPDGLEISRSTANLAAVPIALGKPTTSPRGAFSAPLPPLSPGSYLVEAWFRGGNTAFPSYASARITHP